MLRDLFATRTGVKLSVEARFALERRLRERLIVLKLATFADYHHYLRFSTGAADEWDELLPRRSAAPGLSTRAPAHASSTGPSAETTHRLERRLLYGRRGIHDRDPRTPIGIVLPSAPVSPKPAAVVLSRKPRDRRAASLGRPDLRVRHLASMRRC